MTMSDTQVYTAPPGGEQPTDAELQLTLPAVRSSLRTELARLKTLGRKGDLSAHDVLTEIISTVLPMFGDLTEFIRRLETHAEWATEKIDELDDDEEPGNQLLSEDHAALKEFIHACVDFFRSAYDGLGVADKVGAENLLTLADSGDKMLKMLEDCDVLEPAAPKGVVTTEGRAVGPGDDDDKDDDDADGDDGEDGDDDDDDDDDDGGEE